MKRVLLCLTVLLSACDGFFAKSVNSICEDHPNLCNDLNPDGWCRAEKAHIIKNRYSELDQASDLLNYRLLISFEDYKACISKAAQIEHIKLREKEVGRMKGLLTAERELKRLARLTRQSKDPHLLYYHWSRFGNKESLQYFLSYEKQGKLETSELQLALASYYVKFDLPKAQQLLYHALELYQSNDEIDNEIFTSLTTLYMKLEDYPNAYTWAYVARKFNAEGLDLVQVETLLPHNQSNLEQLQKRAEKYVSDIKDGEFKSPI